MFRSFRSKDLLFSSFLILSNSLFSGTTGKVSGVVISSETKVPLIGVNVVLANTSLGTVTDSLGTFALLNIPPGDYSIQASMIGYADFILEDVIIKIDQTSIVDIFLTQRSIEMERSLSRQPDQLSYMISLIARSILHLMRSLTFLSMIYLMC